MNSYLRFSIANGRWERVGVGAECGLFCVAIVIGQAESKRARMIAHCHQYEIGVSRFVKNDKILTGGSKIAAQGVWR